MKDLQDTVILVVDDDDAGRYAVTRILSQEGFAVWEASTGRETLEKAREHPDMVILDINLPDISGLEVCRQLKGREATSMIPVLLLSATFIMSQDRSEGLEGGADGYLVQPVEPRELLATMKSLLRMKFAEDRSIVEARQWNTTFDAIHDSICLLDTRGMVLRCNQAFLDLVQKKLEEAQGAFCYKLIHGADSPVGPGPCQSHAECRV